MVLIKLRTIATALITFAALASGSLALPRQAPAPRPQPDLDQIRADLGAQGAGGAGRREAPRETGPPPKDLTWTDIAPAGRLRVIELLAAQLRGNYEKIKTWQGAYSYVLRQYLDERFVAQLLAAARLPAHQSPPQGKAEALIQEFDSVLTFAIDVGSDAIDRDTETSRMRFLKVGTGEGVKVPNVGPPDHRSIVTPGRYLVFRPKERATSAFLPDHPDAEMERRAERFPCARPGCEKAANPTRARSSSSIPPTPSGRDWSCTRGRSGASWGAGQKEVVEQRLRVGQADGPGGRWYLHQMGFTGEAGPMLWVTTLWSP
jgi:hypothetical protein